jgi:hypothetical protein
MSGPSKPTPAEEAAAESELLRLCLANARDAAWAMWFHECIFTAFPSKVQALTAYRAWEAMQQERRGKESASVGEKPKRSQTAQEGTIYD